MTADTETREALRKILTASAVACVQPMPGDGKEGGEEYLRTLHRIYKTARASLYEEVRPGLWVERAAPAVEPRSSGEREARFSRLLDEYAVAQYDMGAAIGHRRDHLQHALDKRQALVEFVLPLLRQREPDAPTLEEVAQVMWDASERRRSRTMRGWQITPWPKASAADQADFRFLAIAVDAIYRAALSRETP